MTLGRCLASHVRGLRFAARVEGFRVLGLLLRGAQTTGGCNSNHLTQSMKQKALVTEVYRLPCLEQVSKELTGRTPLANFLAGASGDGMVK